MAESPGHLIRERLQQIRPDAAFVGAYVNLRRHAGFEHLGIGQAGRLVLDIDARREIRKLFLLILDQIRRDALDRSLASRRGAGIESGKPDRDM